ncbi:MAG: pyruvate flavodoxin/ferredoxin oxidoreductase [Thermoleophilia bacterium]|nr:pyruvate flavodoxin/ferredoxin oxidoreductase [Thermoleophilia bacterium]
MIEFLEGNDAVVRAAVEAGCRFFAGYPITPATSILTGMMRALPKVGGVAVQGEDEIASIGLCIGAAMTGKVAMTATSGPGMSLYSENIGLAVMGETPLVIVDVQRQGPATGSATKGADGDIEFLRWGTSGGLPLFVLSPENVRECYTLTREAFVLAERYRTPVVLASQKEVGLTREAVDLQAARDDSPSVFARPLADPEAPYLPHAFHDPADVAPMSPIGGPHLVRYTTSMHDKRALLAKDPALIGEMMEHLARKILAHAEEHALYDLDPQEGADTLLVAYGVTARAAREAVVQVRAAGKKAALLVLKTLFPVPEKAIGEALAGVSRVVVPEMNLGQYVEEVRKLSGDREVVSVAKMNTDLLSPEEIIAQGGLL